MNTKALFENVLAQGSYIELNTRLVQKLGIKEAILLYELIGQQHHFGKKKALKDGWFYATNDFLSTSTLLSEKQINAAAKVLEEEKLISTKYTFSYGEKIKWYKVDTKAVDDCIRSGDGSVSMNTIRYDAFIIYNKIIARKTNPTAAVVFSDLLTSYYFTEACENLEDDEWFMNIYHNQAARLGVSRQILVTKYIPLLVDLELINKKTMGEKNKTFISINWDKLFEILAGCTVEETDDGVVIKKERSEVERITQKMLDRVKEVSGLDWKFNYSKCAFIEDRLEEGISEQDMYDVIEYKYKDYLRLDGKYFKRFNWTNLFGSCCGKWIENMHNSVAEQEEYLRLEALADRIVKEVEKITKGKIIWRLDDRFFPLLQKQLDCGVSEDELVELVKYRYDWKIKNNETWKTFSWRGLYREDEKYSCFSCIMGMRKEKDKIARKGQKNKNFKFNNYKNTGSKDIATSRSITQEDIEFQNKCKERGVEGEDVF